MATNHSIQMEEYAFHPIRLCSEAGCNLVDNGGGLCLSHSRKSSGPLKKRPYRLLSEMDVVDEGGGAFKNIGAKSTRRRRLCSHMDAQVCSERRSLY